MKFLLSLITLIFMNISMIFSNPLLREFKAPFGMPPFDQIKEEHYIPAFEEAMKLHNKEIEDILKDKSKPTFKNTVEKFERSGYRLYLVSRIFFNHSSANTNPEIQKIAKEMAPKLTKHYDEIMMNDKLFQKIKMVYEQGDKGLNTEQKTLLEKIYKSFVKSGANLSPEQKKELKAINEELSVLTVRFGENILNENNRFQLVIEDENDLSGLPQNVINQARETANQMGLEGKWVFTLHNPSVMPFLQYADNRDLRHKIWLAYVKRGDNGDEYDNNEIIKRIVELRIKKAQLLGYKNWAELILEDNMAKNPGNVYDLLKRLWEQAIKVAQKESEQQQLLIKESGEEFKLEPWDWRYYAEKLRKKLYDIDEEALKPYFKLENVKNGIFTLVNKLYGLQFKERKDLPKYHNEVVVYEVLEKDGRHIGILMMDFHPRAGKRGGAWMTSYREQFKIGGKNITPIIAIVCNFSRPTADEPALLTVDEVETFFHEFGHALHGLLSNCTYLYLSGTSVPRDFVELPSQIMENWAFEPEVLSFYAKHYKTGEVIPYELVKKLKESEHFNQGFKTVEYLSASFLDMAYHTLEKYPADFSPSKFEEEVLGGIGLIPEIISRYRSTYFNHIFSGGYSAGYYSYIWSEMLDSDAFQAFRDKGLFDQTLAGSFRKNILEKGGTEDPMTLYINFRGAQPSIEPLLRKRGLLFN